MHPERLTLILAEPLGTRLLQLSKCCGFILFRVIKINPEKQRKPQKRQRNHQKDLQLDL